MNQKGVSLIEVLVVISLMGILSVAFSFSMKQIDQARFYTLADQMKLMMHTAQQHAHLKGERVRITVYKRLPSYKQFISITANNQSYYTMEVPEEVEISIGNFNQTSVIKELAFYADMSPVQGGTITLTHEGLKEQIKITLRPVTGKLTLYKE